MISVKSLSFLAILSPFVVAASAAPAWANLITNGSFETAATGYTLPTGNGTALPTGSTAIAGWTVIDGHSGDGLAWLPNGNGYGVTTPFGSYFLDLTGYHDTTPFFGVSQTISTVVGQKYSLSFSLGVDNNTSVYSGPIGVSAVAGTTSQTFNNYNPSGPGNVWQTFSLAFTATTTSTDISLNGIQGDQYIGLDNVAVNSVSSVPLPPALPMFGAAVLTLAAFSYRAKRKGSRAMRSVSAAV